MVQGLLVPIDPSFRALSGRLQFTVRRHKFNNILSLGEVGLKGEGCVVDDLQGSQLVWRSRFWSKLSKLGYTGSSAHIVWFMSGPDPASIYGFRFIGDVYGVWFGLL